MTDRRHAADSEPRTLSDEIRISFLDALTY
jgi:hypothetical protein